jgi:hypothetical protein
MRRHTLIGFAAAVAVAAIFVGEAGAAAPRVAKTYAVHATLDARHVVTPANKRWTPPAGVRAARGSFTGRLSVSSGSRSLEWKVSYADVGVARLPIVDIHLGRPGHFGQLLVRLCAPCTSGRHGTKKLTAAAVRAITSGEAWVTLISERFPNGVIRGQISANPSNE